VPDSFHDDAWTCLPPPLGPERAGVALMRAFARVCEAVAATPSKTEKVRLVSEYLLSQSVPEASAAAVFLTGRVYPRRDSRTFGVGSALLVQAVVRISGEAGLEAAWRRHGDLGGMAGELLSAREGEDVPLSEVASVCDQLTRRRSVAGKVDLLEQLLRRLRPVEAKYVVKVLVGDLRIGLQESLVEEAIARAFDADLEAVQRANMLVSDVGETLRLAHGRRLSEAKLQLFHPVGFMLASPAETAAEALAAVGGEALVEDKYDGIRAQAHVAEGRAALYSRNLEEIPEFPELLEPLRRLGGPLVLDGEIVGYAGERPLPFTRFQRRLGRKQRELFIADEIPVRFLVFDILYQDGGMLWDVPLRERRQRLEALLPPEGAPFLRLALARPATRVEQVEAAFDDALARGNEGVLVKEPRSTYRPGRRGQAWIKLKRPYATLDVVVTGVEYGHGKRKGVLSDYTFSVRDGERLVTLGKAFTGLTDAEIERLTQVFLASTLEERGRLRRVRPEVVLEVAFGNIQTSKRHESGFALRFPRIVRLRPDKTPEEIDTLDRVRALHARAMREGEAGGEESGEE
jgi:DNA ligase-1